VNSRADVVGFGGQQVFVAPSNGSAFEPAQAWLSGNYGRDSLGRGWDPRAYPRFQSEVNGDRRADVVGIGYSWATAAFSSGNGGFER
jgi:hypothetical protein